MAPLNRSVLIEDDERDVGIRLKLVLENHGFVVDCFTDPVMALNNFRSGLSDLLILDIKMPEINGFELYNQFKLKDAKIKTLFLTALSSSSAYDEQRSRVYPKMGERRFLQKPTNNNQLLEQVYTIMN
jgi:DNA-binding response OmpR family regulator